jgi:uncharacterized BrkB/YihY/UPF0761 family membrane protein
MSFNFIKFLSFFGLLLALVSIPFASTPVFAQISVPNAAALCKGATCPGGITDNKAQQFNTDTGIVVFISRIAQFLTFLAAAVAVLYMVWGGYNFITANGDEEKVKKGKDTLIYASVGLVVTIVAYTIVLVVSNVANGQFLSGIF